VPKQTEGKEDLRSGPVVCVSGTHAGTGQSGYKQNFEVCWVRKVQNCTNGRRGGGRKTILCPSRNRLRKSPPGRGVQICISQRVNSGRIADLGGGGAPQANE